ncbi:MAG: type II toxin-antitoxin system VapC family toxin [Boseongicola sp.]|nr:type II toxin-antitoxin system VapC family toxin [Boseongicola sp.]
MILIDTNVISEPLRAVPEPRVAEWLDAQALETLYISAITVAELRFGVHALPAGRRRHRLHDDLERQVLPMFAGRVLSFDLAASQDYAELMARARSAGRAVSVSDGYIAATAVANGMMVATRDTAPFRAAGLETIDPWAA